MSLNEIASAPVSTILGTLAASILAGVFTFQKMRQKWISTSAETDVIKLLRDEIERLSKQNLNLSSHLFEMQIQVNDIKTENQTLRLKVMRLEEEITEYRSNDNA